MTADCDPCRYCQNIYCQVDHIGDCAYGNDVSYCECDADIGDWEPGCGSACPAFKPILASDSLLEQIADEEEYRFWMEMQDEAVQEGCE